MKSPSSPEKRTGDTVSTEAAEIEETIRILRRTAARGPFSLALFLVLCIAALNLPTLSLSPSTAKLLGPAPSPAIISTLLFFYSFFAILLILARMTQGLGGCTALSHVGFLAGFFAFYYVSGALQENFYPVLIAGLSIIGLETYHAWSFSRERIAEEEERLKSYRRMGDWRHAASALPGEEHRREKNVD